MSSQGRLHLILERLRAEDCPELRKEFVRDVADLEDRNVFDDDRTSALKELRQLVALEVESARFEGEG